RRRPQPGRSTSPPGAAWGAPPTAHRVRGRALVPSGLPLLVVLVTLEHSGRGALPLPLGGGCSPAAGALRVAQRLLQDALVGHGRLVHRGNLRVVQVEGGALGAHAGQGDEV